MYKFRTGDLYLTDSGDIFKITNVCKELMAMSVYNKGVTVEFLYGTNFQIQKLAEIKELNVSIDFFETHNAKYIGSRDDVAHVLYGTNLKREMNHEENVNTSLFVDAALVERQDD